MRLINGDALEESLKESADRCREWITDCMDAKDHATQRIAEQALLTFDECIMRIKSMPTIEERKTGLKRTERGWAGHFIAADSCRFRRNTLLEYKDLKWVVSTVGCCCIGEHIDTIGYERWYETRVFEATYQDGYLDADVTKQIEISQDWGIWGRTWEEVMENYPAPDNAANDMHERIVDEMIERIRGGA